MEQEASKEKINLENEHFLQIFLEIFENQQDAKE